MIGSRIVHKLVNRSAKVRIIDNLSAYPSDQLEHFGIKGLDSVEVVGGDIRDRATVRGAMKDVDIVFHQAAFADVAASIWNPDEDLSSNVVGTFNLLKAALEYGVERFVFASSAAVYGEQTCENAGAPRFCEDMKPSPVSTYANSKLWGEHEATLFCELYGLKTTSLRYFSVYGIPQVPKKGSHSWVVAIFVIKALKGQPLTVFGDGKQLRDFIHVDEVAEANLIAAETNSAVNRTINVGTGKPTTIMQLAHLVRKVTGAKVPIVFGPRPRGDPFGGYADITLMKKILSWEPSIDLEKGILQYHEWITNERDVIPDWL